MERTSLMDWRRDTECLHWCSWALMCTKPSPGAAELCRKGGGGTCWLGRPLTLRQILTNGWWNSGNISSLGKYCLLATVIATTLCNTGQGKAKGIEAGCKEGDIVYVAGMKESCLMWWDRHGGWKRKTDPDELGWKGIWDYNLVWGNPVRSLGFSKVRMKVMAGGVKQPKV